MTKHWLTRRLSLLPLTLVVVTILAFSLTVLAQGDPALLALSQDGVQPTPEALERYRSSLGLDRPLPEQYLRWLASVTQGDLGLSFLSRRPVVEILGERLWPTLQLALLANLVALSAGVMIGVILAVRGGRIDRLGRHGLALLGAIPGFWLALGLVALVSVRLRWTPVAGSGTWRHLVLPVITLATGATATLGRVTRGAMLDVMGSEWMRTARGKGLPGHSIALRHALPNAAAPLLTVVGLRFGHLLTGAIIIESIFGWPGMGTTLLTALSGRDTPVIAGYILLVAPLVIVANLAADLLIYAIDPRVRSS